MMQFMELAKHDRTLPHLPRPPAPRPTRQPALWLVATGLVLTAFNLRLAITGLGPVLAEVRDDLGMSGTTAGLLTSLPALCFGIFGIAAPRLARQFGPAAVVVAALLAIVTGLVLRSFTGSTWAFLATSALALAGTAIGNVLMPVLVARHFPGRVGAMTGYYSTALALGAGVGAACTFPLARALGDSWRAGLGVWAAVAALAVLPWLAAGKARPHDRRRPGATPTPVAPAPRLARSGTAWALAGFVGLQANSAYIIGGWVPQIFRDAGVPAGTAGLLLAVIMGLGAPLGFVLPRIAARMGHQGPLVAVLGLFGLTGYAGLWLAPVGGAWVWAVLLGISNCAFPVALTMIGMRASTSQGVARLSAFTQSVGYLICVPGPLLVGTLNDVTGGWDAPLALMAALMIAQIGVGTIAGRDRRIEDGG